jgi:phosphinothricin acetyltransferase
MSAVIRLAQASDAEAIQAIYAPLVLSTPVSFELEPPSADEMRRRMSAAIDELPWLVCELDGVIAGYAYARRHRERPAYRWSVESSVYVDAAFHRRGIGRALYTSLFEILALQGHRNVLAGITLPNPASEVLHRCCGFTQVGVFPAVGFKFGRWHDVAWLHRPLSDQITHPASPHPVSDVRSTDEFRIALEAGARQVDV